MRWWLTSTYISRDCKSLNTSCWGAIRSEDCCLLPSLYGFLGASCWPLCENRCWTWRAYWSDPAELFSSLSRVWTQVSTVLVCLTIPPHCFSSGLSIMNYYWPIPKMSPLCDGGNVTCFAKCLIAYNRTITLWPVLHIEKTMYWFWLNLSSKITWFIAAAAVEAI